MKERLDRALVSRNLVRSRTEAQELIRHGKVLVNKQVISKPSFEVSDADIIRVTERLPYVSRGGLKLQHALEHFAIDVRAKIVLDIGSSTGGFTDCLLQNGAVRVYAVDVGTFQMEQKLRGDSRVVLMEQTDIRNLSQLPEKVDGIVIDVSFISLEHIFPSITRFLKPGGFVIALVKPQFEVGRGNLNKHGVVINEETRKAALTKILTVATQSDLTIKNVTESPILGGDGNKEFLLLCEYHF